MLRFPRADYCLTLLLLTMACTGVLGDTQNGAYDEEQALAISQAAIGSKLSDFEFTNGQGQTVNLREYQGKPLLISLIFTSCYHVCPALTRHLKLAVEAAREALGDKSFKVVTIGFDTANDSPERMQEFAREQGVDEPDWAFLSANAATMDKLVENLGFVYFPTARGFDHITQTTIVDGGGTIYEQVYGGAFELPWLVEPLKELVFNRPRSAHNFFSGVADKVRLFCTVYDPNTGKYRIDYSLFVQIAIGALAILGVLSYLFLETRRSRRKNRGG